MKNLKIISVGFVLFCFVISLKGQTEQGNVLLGGESYLSFAYSNEKWKSDDGDGDHGKTTNLDLSPLIGFFVADGLALGVQLPIMYSLQKDNDGDKYSSTSLAFAPFLRYYFGTSNIKPFVHGKAGIGITKTKYEPVIIGSSQEASYNKFLYEIGGGLAIFLNEKVSLDIGIGYSSRSNKAKKDNDNNYRTIFSALGLVVGIEVVL